MISKTSLAIAALTAALAAAYATVNPDRREPTQKPERHQRGTDQIVASFERAMNHEPSEAPAAERNAMDTDLLYWMLNRPHWTSAQSEPPTSVGPGAPVDENRPE